MKKDRRVIYFDKEKGIGHPYRRKVFANFIDIYQVEGDYPIVCPTPEENVRLAKDFKSIWDTDTPIDPSFKFLENDKVVLKKK